MSTTLKALGVQFHLSNSVKGHILVCNTEKRKRELADKIDEVLKSGSLTSPAAASLKGRLGFAGGQLFGRATRKLLNELGQHAIRTPPNGKLSEATQFALRRGLLYLGVEGPLSEIYVLDSKTGGLGGVLLDASGKVLSRFGCELDGTFCSSVMVDGQEQVIGELETLPVLVGFDLWKERSDSI